MGIVCIYALCIYAFITVLENFATIGRKCARLMGMMVVVGGSKSYSDDADLNRFHFLGGFPQSPK